MLCVIPARGGSKRILNKNIAVVAGQPMLAWTIQAAQEAGLDPIVSTESEEISKVAALYGAKVSRRPLALAADTSSTEDTLIHVYDAAWRKAVSQDAVGNWVMCLPPTSPCRTAATIKAVMDTPRGEEVDCPDGASGPCRGSQ